MKNVKLIAVGNVKESFYRNKISEYIKNSNEKINLNVVELPDCSIPKNAGDTIMQGIKEKEGELILSNIENKDYVVALCIDGKMTDEKKISKLFLKADNIGKESICFVIGGSLGLSDKVCERADYKMSFGKMTFPHQLMRVMLLEQLFMVSDIV